MRGIGAPWQTVQHQTYKKLLWLDGYSSVYKLKRKLLPAIPCQVCTAHYYCASYRTADDKKQTRTEGGRHELMKNTAHSVQVHSIWHACLDCPRTITIQSNCQCYIRSTSKYSVFNSLMTQIGEATQPVQRHPKHSMSIYCTITPVTSLTTQRRYVSWSAQACRKRTAIGTLGRYTTVVSLANAYVHRRIWTFSHVRTDCFWVVWHVA